LSLFSFQESLIKALLGIPADLTDGQNLVRTGPLHGGQREKTAFPARPSLPPPRNTLEHLLEKIPLPENCSRKNYFLRCRQCSKQGKKGQTSWRCVVGDARQNLHCVKENVSKTYMQMRNKDLFFMGKCYGLLLFQKSTNY
jgi:hypothetical protein